MRQEMNKSMPFNYLKASSLIECIPEATTEVDQHERKNILITQEQYVTGESEITIKKKSRL
jgi:hypothetical protein